jgi:Serine/threonine protein kinase
MTASDTKKKTKGTGAGRTPGPASKTEAVRICPACRAENAASSRFCGNCATPLQDTGAPLEAAPDGPRTVRASTVELARGNRLAGRYEIIEELGRGGMGKVFKAYDHKISEVIALKLIRPEISAQEKAIERFKNELKFTRRITHRRICRMYDLGEEDFLYYITMEYVAGEDLKRFVRRAGPLNAGKAVMIAGQICDGLAEAHRIGAIHRDLKPQNIMIDADGNAKIMDFGIARFTEMERVTGSGVMIGTPEYMSPEQAELGEVDARSDIYSLGVVLFEMVTGRVPFEGATPLSLAMKHKMEVPPERPGMERPSSGRAGRGHRPVSGKGPGQAVSVGRRAESGLGGRRPGHPDGRMARPGGRGGGEDAGRARSKENSGSADRGRGGHRGRGRLFHFLEARRSACSGIGDGGGYRIFGGSPGRPVSLGRHEGGGDGNPDDGVSARPARNGQEPSDSEAGFLRIQKRRAAGETAGRVAPGA